MDAKREWCFELVPVAGRGSSYFDRGAQISQTHCNQYDQHQKFTFDSTTGVISILENTDRCVGMRLPQTWLDPNNLPGRNVIMAKNLYFDTCDQSNPEDWQSWTWDYPTGRIWSKDGEWCLSVAEDGRLMSQRKYACMNTRFGQFIYQAAPEL